MDIVRLLAKIMPSRLVVVEDLVMDTYRLLHAKWLLGEDAQDVDADWNPDTPDYIAVGSGLWGSGLEERTALKCEVARVQVQTKQVKELGMTVRFGAEFPKGTATMTWHEIGLFNAPEIATTISECDSEGTAPNWTYGGNSGSLELVDYRQGVACLEATGTSPSVRFLNETLGVTPVNITTNGYLQLYYYASTIGALAGTLQIKIGNDSDNYWQFDTVCYENIVAGWQYLSFKISDASSTVGSPGLASTINYFCLGHTDLGGWTLTDRIDFIRFFEENGDMYTRHELAVGSTKGVNEIKHVIMKLRIRGN